MSELSREQVEDFMIGTASHRRIILDHDAALRAKLEAMTQERDLAIAHDRQPYPTAHAYEQVCKALEVHKQQLAASEQHLEQQRTATYRAMEREHAAKQKLVDAQETIAALRSDLRYQQEESLARAKKNCWWRP